MMKWWLFLLWTNATSAAYQILMILWVDADWYRFAIAAGNVISVALLRIVIRGERSV